MTDPTLVKLRELLLNEFNEAELADLCRDIGLNYEALPGTGAFGKSRELVEAARTHDKLRALQSRVRELRPEAYAASGLAPGAATVAATTAVAATTLAAAPVADLAAPVVPAAVVPDGATSPRQTRRDAAGVGPLPLIALGLVALLCVVVGLAAILPRMNEVPIAATSSPLAPTGSAAGDAVPLATAAPGQLIPTAAVTEAGGVLVPLATENPAVIVPTLAPVPVEGQVAGDATAAGAATIITATGTAPLTQPPAIVGIATVSPSGQIDDHPAAATVRTMNEQLPQFYEGRVSEQDIQQFWTGEALRSVTGFGATRLLRAMRLQPAQRDALEISYRYLSAPKLAGATGNTAIVTSREEWRYANTLNDSQICEVRDYVYNLIKENERYRVRDFNSRLVQSGCQPQ